MKHAPVKTEIDAAKIINELYADAQNGLRRVVALGLFCEYWKTQIQHGEFQAWLEANCPSVSYKSIAVYRGITLGVCDSIGLKLDAYFQKSSALDFSHPGEFLLLPEGDLPEDLRPFQKKAFDIIDGQSQRSLVLKLKSNQLLGGFHPSAARVQKWLAEHAPDHVGTKYDDLPADVQAACKKWMLKNPEKISAADRARLRAQRGQRWLVDGAEAMDEGHWKDYDAQHLQELKGFLYDYYKLIAKAATKAKGKRK